MPHFSEQQWEKEMECKFSHDIVDVCRGCGWKRFPDYPGYAPSSALACTLAEREVRYGDFTDHARIADTINQALMSGGGWQKASPAHREALRIIANKLGRIVNGDPNYYDSWHDIAGYATLAEQRCV